MTAADHGDYVVHGELPRLDRPVLVVAMAGWIDAGGAAAAAMAEITSTCSIQPLATFDAENARLKRLAREGADPKDLELRRPQEQHLTAIRERLFSNKSNAA